MRCWLSDAEGQARSEMRADLITQSVFCMTTLRNIRKPLSTIRSFCKYVKASMTRMERLWLTTVLGLTSNSWENRIVNLPKRPSSFIICMKNLLTLMESSLHQSISGYVMIDLEIKKIVFITSRMHWNSQFKCPILVDSHSPLEILEGLELKIWVKIKIKWKYL